MALGGFVNRPGDKVIKKLVDMGVNREVASRYGERQAWTVLNNLRRKRCTNGQMKYLRFLKQDESFVICADANGGIECGIHGHNGANGRPGSAMQLAQMGRKTNTGHSHSAGIWFGAYVSGITGDLEQGYNVGQSSWTRSHIGTYPNGKRVIITCYGKGKHPPKWRA